MVLFLIGFCAGSLFGLFTSALLIACRMSERWDDEYAENEKNKSKK